MKIKKILNEAFSPSMPIWLKNFFLYNTPRRDKRFVGKRIPLVPKGSDTDYELLRYTRNIGRDADDLRAINILNELGINLEKAKFNEINPPPKLNSPIFQDEDKLCISWLKSNYDQTLWLSGAKSSAPHEKFTLDDGKEIALLYLNNKQYQSICKGFCWLDMTDSTNFRQKDQQARAAARQGTVERDRKRGKEAEKIAQRVWGSTNFDKSGYYKIPAVERHADELAKRRYTKLADALVTNRESLIKLKDDLTTVLGDAINEFSQQKRRRLFEAWGKLDNALESLNRAKSWAELINASPSPSSRDVRRMQNALDECQSSIEEAYSFIGDYIPTTIDYDIDDEGIYDDSDWEEFK